MRQITFCIVITLLITLLIFSVTMSYGYGNRPPTSIPPLVNAGSDQIVEEGEIATLDGSATTDPNDLIRSYFWEIISGPSVTLSNPSAILSTFIVPKISTDGSVLTFRLTITDNEGLQTSDTCVVTISFVNQPPIADAGETQEVSEGDTVRLNAAKSSDPDDGIMSLHWVQDSGTSVVLSGKTSATPSFIVPDVGREGDSLKFKLTVTDNGGLMSSASVVVNVSYKNKVPVADAGANQTIPEGTTVVLNGANSSDTDGDNLSYMWSQIDGVKVVLSSSSIAVPSFSTPDVGAAGAVLKFKLTVTDQVGAASTDTCTVNVLFVNQAPVAEAGNNQTVKEGDIARLNAGDSMDADGGIVSYLWEQVAGHDVKLSDPFGINPSFIAPDVGEDGLALTFRLTVTDQAGLKSTDACIVNISFVNAPPVANAGVTQIVSEGSLTTLNAGNSIDPDGNIQSYLWEQVDGPKVRLLNFSSVRPTFVAPDTGVEGVNLSFKVTVMDKGGLTSSDTCLVKVVFVNQAPVAEAGASQTVEEGSKVILDATGSADPDDGIKSYLWSKIAGPDVTLSNTSSITPEFTAPDVDSEGISLTFKVIVTDNSGLQSSDACIINISFVNSAPVAEAGDAQSVFESTKVTLDGSQSFDPDGKIISYLWKQIGGSSVALSGDSEISPEFITPVVGVEGTDLTFQLTVTDTGGLKSIDTCVVSVNYINEPPIAKAGVDQIVAEGGSVTLNAGGSIDSDDGIESYLWEQTLGRDVTLSDIASVNPTFTAPATGTEGTILNFRLTVTDRSGLQSTDTCTVNVSYVNKAPVAEAGNAQIVTEGSLVTLSGAGSSDPDDGIKSYLWTKIAGPDVSLSNTSSVNPTFTAPDVGVEGISLTFQLTVTDNEGSQSSDAIIVNVTFVNTAPLADAGANQVIAENTLVTLNAANSSDPDDGIETYEWSQLEGQDIVLSDNSAINPTFVAPSTGGDSITLKFKIIVTDYGGLQSSDTSTVTLTSDGGKSITLEWDTNDDADYYVVYWGQISGEYTDKSLDIKSPTTSYTVSGLGEATYFFAVKAFNECGNSSDYSTEITHNLTGRNAVPVADAGQDQIVTSGTKVSLTGLGSTDPDDGIQSYHWTQVAGISVSLENSSSEIASFTAPTTGTEGTILNFQLTVTDKSGLQSTDTCTVNISYVNKAPVAEAGNAQIVTEGSLVTLSGGGSTDPDDGIKSYHWTQVAGISVSLENSSLVNTSFTAPTTGTEGTILNFQLTVTDKSGLQSTDTCTVNISYVNQAPVAEAGNAQIVTEGSRVTLSGAGSSDPDDGIKSYFWTKIAGPDISLSNTSSVNPTFTAPDVGVEGISLTFQLTVTDNEGSQSSDATIVNVTFVNTAPMADAGANQVMAENTLVTLNAANSSDPDDGIETYEWSQIEGQDIILSDNSAINPTFVVPPISGDSITIKFKVIVTDYGGLQSSDTSTVTLTASGGKSITLEWDANDDADYYVVYWGQTSGTYTNNSPDIKSPATSYIVTGLGEATYFFAVKAFNECGNSSDFSTEITHNLTGSNAVPVADAGQDQTVSPGTKVSLTGLGSTASDDGVKSYQWTQIAGISVSLENSSSVNAVFTAPDSGVIGSVLTFKLTVSDSGGLLASDTCSVNIQGTGSTGASSVTLQWDTNSDADYYIVYWGINSKNYTDQSEQVKNPTTTYIVSDLDASTYYFAVKAFNACGNSSDFSTEIVHNLSFVSTEVTSSDGSKPSTETGFVQSLPGGLPADGTTVTPDGESVQPVSPDSLISFLTNNPSIEFLDSDLKHLEWLQTGWSEYNRLNGEARIAAGDIDGDGEDEIIIGFGSVPGNTDIPGGFFQILDHDFSHLAWGQINWPEYNAINGETWPTCGDIDDDGDDEIIIGLGVGGEGTIEIFDYDRNGLFHIEWVISSWSEYNSLIGETRPVAGDIDGDGYEEIVVGFASREENDAMPNGYFEIIESDLNHASWGNIEWEEYNSINGETWLTCGDITGNGSYEIIAGLGAGSNGQVEIFEYLDNEVLHIDWLQVDWVEYNSSNGETRPAASDIDNDGKDEIILGLGPIDGNTSIPGGRYLIKDDDFSLLEWLQIDWANYNAVNGSTRPVSAVINDSQAIFIGLGEK